MDLTSLRHVSRHRHPATPAETQAASDALGTALPSGYAAFVEQHGEGTTDGFFRVYAPRDLAARTAEWRERITEYWFWETDGIGVDAETLQTRGIVFADTLDGDEMCFVAGAPDRCFVLPRNEDDAYAVDGGLVECLAWFRSEDQDHQESPATFESWTDRTRVDVFGPGDAGAVRDAVLALGVHDLVRADGASTQVLVPDIGGVVVVRAFTSGGVDRVSVSVDHDDDAPAEAVARVLDVLSAHGLAAPQQ